MYSYRYFSNCVSRGLWRTMRLRPYSKKAGFHLKISPEVKEAVECNKPVVALESTIITHGLPYPQNLEMAMAVEGIVRGQGAVPATIAVLKGSPCIGLNKTQLESLSASADEAVKLPKRDLPFAITKGLTGGTTISATMHLAHSAGIPIFVTGGLGGVHRGGENSLDISGDLTELGQTPVAVVSSGVKSILDIGRTLEYLETQGVVVTTFASSKEFPAFFHRSSGHQVAYNVTNTLEAAQLIQNCQDLGLQNGVLIAVPIPDEFSHVGDEIDEATKIALDEAGKKKITGAAVTPYVLGRIHELTNQSSVDANIGLVKNNAFVGSGIAVALNQLSCLQLENAADSHQPKYSAHSTGIVTGNTSHHRSASHAKTNCNRPVVVGGTNFDHIVKLEQPLLGLTGSTHQSSVTYCPGGVGRNVADGLSRLGTDVALLSAVGKDIFFEQIERECQHMDWSNVKRLSDDTTSVYFVVADEQGSILLGLQNMEINKRIDVDYIKSQKDLITNAPFVCVDGNIPASTMRAVLEICHDHNIPVFFEPTDTQKARVVFQEDLGKYITFVKPNYVELLSMYAALAGSPLGAPDVLPGDWRSVLECVSEACVRLSSQVPHLLVSLGEHGVLVCINKHRQKMSFNLGNVVSESPDHQIIHYPAKEVKGPIINASGAGDSFTAGFLHGYGQSWSGDRCVSLGLECASLSLLSHSTMSADLDKIDKH